MKGGTCIDCAELVGKLTRQRCTACYARHLRALRRDGTYVSRCERAPLLDRLLDKTAAGWGGCIVWTGALREGYGAIHHKGRMLRAHRVAYQLLVGPIPEGLVLDHLCRNRRCINPHHLEPVTMRVNTMRSPIAPSTINALKTHCPKDHEYTPENTYRRANGHRGCRACGRIAARDRYARQMTATGAGVEL